MILRAAFATLFAFMLASQVWAVPDTVLHNFATMPDSENSYSTLVADQYGNLYGTSAEGGAYGLGTVFVLCAPGAIGPSCNGAQTWQEIVLYSFKGLQGGDGANPYSTLIFGGDYADRSFTLYGTTYNGGNDTCAGVGCGTVFELCAPAAWGGCGGAGWTENILHEFTGGSDGSHPFAGVIEDKANYLYGTTVFGGGKGVCKSGGVNLFCGTVFKMKHDAAWVFTESPIHRFKGAATDGAEPYAALCCDTTIAAISTLYGTTVVGGKNKAGTVFQVLNTVPHTETLLYNFCSINGCADGANPYANVIIDSATGNMFGTTAAGGVPTNGCGGSGCGTIFKLATLPVPLYNFAGSPDGATPTAGLTLDSGVLYGTTFRGGTGSCGGLGCGTVMQYTLPAGPELVRYSFTGSTVAPFDGANPWGGVIFDPVVGGLLYGTTVDAGEFGFGVGYSQ